MWIVLGETTIWCELQAVSKQAKQKGLQQSAPPAGLLTSPSKGKSSLAKNSSMPVPQSEPPQMQPSRLRRGSHPDTDRQPIQQGNVEQAGSSATAAKAMVEQKHHRRSTRVPIKPTGMWQLSDQAELEPGPQPAPEEATQTPLSAAKRKGKGKKANIASPKEKAEGVQQKAAGSKSEAFHLPSGLPASVSKAATSKGKQKGTKPHAAPNSMAKVPAGTEHQAAALTQSPALRAKPRSHAKKEAAATAQVESSLKAEKLEDGNADNTPLAVSMGKRKRTATKFLHMEDDSCAPGQAGSKARSSDKMPQDVRSISTSSRPCPLFV